MWVEATGDVSKNKMYGFGLHAHSSSILIRTPTSCSTSPPDDLQGVHHHLLYCPKNYGDYTGAYYNGFD